jgi:F-type H+-transporting ATPase subunit b
MAQAQTNHATTEAPGGAHEDIGFPPFETETYAGQLLWLAITFVVLYTLLSRLVLPRLGGIIENRRAMIANDLDDAALAAAKGRAQALAQETRAKLSAESDANRKALEADLNQRLADAEATITSKKAEAMSHVDAIARDTASAIIERLTGKAPAPQKVEAALNQIKA